MKKQIRKQTGKEAKLIIFASIIFLFIVMLGAVETTVATTLAVNTSTFENSGSEQIAYSLLVHFSSGKFNLETIDLIESGSMPAEKGNEYAVQVMSFSGYVLFETTFNAKLQVFDADIEFLTERTIDLLLPYYPTAKSIIIKKGRQQFLEIDVSKYSLCNENGKCDGNETLKFCPKECSCGNTLCDAEENYVTCSRDCPSGQQDGDSESKSQNTSLKSNATKTSDGKIGKIVIYKIVIYAIMIIVLIGVSLVVLKYFRKPVKQPTKEQIKQLKRIEKNK